jgi:hypothetical protein
MRKVLFLMACYLCICFPFSSQANEEGQTNKPYKILTFDGGGIRGVFSLQLVAMLEDELHFLKNVDFFAGTSTGSLGAVALAYGMDPHVLVEVFRQKGDLIFQPYSKLMDPLMLNPLYKNHNLKKFLQTVVQQDMTLCDLPKKLLCVAFQLYNSTERGWSPCMLDNFNLDVGRRIKIVDAILRSCAAPTYFPSYQGCIDGGMIANNPSMAALSRALDKSGGNQKLENIRLLSIGTGMTNNCIPGDVEWGAMQWILYCPKGAPTPPHPLFDVLFDGTVEFPHYQAEQILAEHYYRLNAFFSDLPKLDDVSQINRLIKEAERLPINNPQAWEELKAWVRKNFLEDEAS